MVYLHSALWVFVLGHVILASPVEKKEYMQNVQIHLPGSSYQENPYYEPYPYPNQQPHFRPMTPMQRGNDHQGMNLPPGHPPVRPDYRPPMYPGQVLPPLQRPGYPQMQPGNPPVRPPPPRVRPPPVLPIAAELPHDEMCEVLMDHTADSLQMMFGVAMDPLNFSFMHCMHRTELENIIHISMQLMGMDLDYIAIHYPGHARIPRMPLTTCVFQQMYYKAMKQLSDRPDSDDDWTFPFWCGRQQEISPEECEATLDSATPSLDIVSDLLSPDAAQVEWRDTSFLDDIPDNELCFLLHTAKEEIGGSGMSVLFWSSMDITPAAHMIPAYQCYLGYLMWRIGEKLENKIDDGQTITGYCDKQLPVDMLASDESPSSSSSSSSPEDDSSMPVRPPLPYPGMPGMMMESTESDPEDDLPGPPSASQPNTRAWKRATEVMRRFQIQKNEN